MPCSVRRLASPAFLLQPPFCAGMLNMGCAFPDVDRHDGMMASTLAPIVLAVLMHARFHVKRQQLVKKRADPLLVTALEQGHYSLLLMLAYVVFPGTSKSVFETFA